ncbi:hypothetical protein GCM10009827_014970 [Dactylosporangium maewongense]|uniref:Uncharacterized protein n=1 Tax=Dactylosporangium maewongense TaxID=634393 RepID=A0ABN1ZRZ6_9ACTN
MSRYHAIPAAAYRCIFNLHDSVRRRVARRGNLADERHASGVDDDEITVEVDHGEVGDHEAIGVQPDVHCFVHGQTCGRCGGIERVRQAARESLVA